MRYILFILILVLSVAHAQNPAEEVMRPLASEVGAYSLTCPAEYAAIAAENHSLSLACFRSASTEYVIRLRIDRHIESVLGIVPVTEWAIEDGVYSRPYLLNGGRVGLISLHWRNGDYVVTVIIER